MNSDSKKDVNAEKILTSWRNFAAFFLNKQNNNKKYVILEYDVLYEVICCVDLGTVRKILGGRLYLDFIFFVDFVFEGVIPHCLADSPSKMGWKWINFNVTN